MVKGREEGSSRGGGGHDLAEKKVSQDGREMKDSVGLRTCPACFYEVKVHPAKPKPDHKGPRLETSGWTRLTSASQ